MPNMRPNDAIANLPTDELQHSLRAFLQPVTTLLPDVHLRAVAELIAQGIVTSQSPCEPESTGDHLCQLVFV